MNSSFCSKTSINNNEFIYGTASNNKYWLLVEYSSSWSDDPIKNNLLEKVLNERFLNLSIQSEKPRILFIKKTRKQKSISLFFIICKENDAKLKKLIFNAYKDILKVKIEEVFLRLEKEKTFFNNQDSIYLVCTNGKRDKCCSKFGLPIFKELAKLRNQNAWQCSHVGGDRFAPNILCFPSGIYYGQVSVEKVKDIIVENENSRLFIDNLRGRCCYDRFTQVGEYFIRKKISNLDMFDFKFVGKNEIKKNVWKVSFFEISQSLVHEVTYEIENSHFVQQSTCNANKKTHVKQYREINYNSFTY